MEAWEWVIYPAHSELHLPAAGFVGDVVAPRRRCASFPLSSSPLVGSTLAAPIAAAVPLLLGRFTRITAQNTLPCISYRKRPRPAPTRELD